VPVVSKRQPRFSARDPLLDAKATGTLDLHGFGAAEARSALSLFVRGRRGGEILHVITGRGRGSAGAPVLRPLVSGMLKGELAPLVADWSRDATDGGFLLKLR